MPFPQIKPINIYLIVGLLSICIGGYAYHLHVYELEKLRIQEEHKLQKEEERLRKIEEKKNAQFQKIIDRYLADFTQDIGEKMRDYKKNRKMVRELISPVNHETSAYSKNSYDHFTKNLLPFLRKQSAAVIDTFQRYKIALDKELIDETTERKEIFQKRWNDMMKDQIESYIEYFIKEDKLLAKYQELIEFYYVHSKLVEIDDEEDAFIFTRKQDEIKHLEILERLKNVK